MATAVIASHVKLSIIKRSHQIPIGPVITTINVKSKLQFLFITTSAPIRIRLEFHAGN